MGLLPTTLGTRPRLAVEIRPEGVVAARAEDGLALVSAVAYEVLGAGAVVPGLKAGNVAGRAVVVAAVRKVLEAVALKERQATLVVPDAAVRVLLLDFDQMPAKPVEALPVVRFRLKKLLPFDADDAVVSFQVMSTARGLVRVLAVAIPKDVLLEYEGVVREAGFEPGAVLPSTLAACAGLGEMEAVALLVSAGETAVTTAMVQGGVLLLHRTVYLAGDGLGDGPPEDGAAGVRVAKDPAVALFVEGSALPLVTRESTAGEWARQQPVSGVGVEEDEPVGTWAKAQARSLAEGSAPAGWATEEGRVPREEMLPRVPSANEREEQRLTAAAREVTQAVSVAVAYFEDTLGSAPGVVLSAGTMGAEVLGTLLREAGFTEGEMRVREMVEPEMLTGGAVSARVPRGWMAGVRGALRS